MIKVDDVVDFHSMIGEEITSKDHIVKNIIPMPNNFGVEVAWITGKSGCVSVDSLSINKKSLKSI